LPFQTVHDGNSPAHDAMRLCAMVEAPADAITAILRKHDRVRQLLDSGWLHFFALTDGQISARYHAGLKWEEVSNPVARAS
jgi:uncharacterized protein YbcC (UPF0753/DUF2309 family)